MKQTFTILCFVASIFLSSIAAPAQWAPVATYPGSISDGTFSFTINDKLYVGGGVTASGPVNHMFEYDPATDSWTAKAPVGGNIGRAWAFAFAVNGKGYVMGGDSTTSFTVANDLWMYDPTTDQWTKKADFPQGPRDAGFSFVLNGKVYIGCGFNGTNVVADVWEYDPVADAWQAVGNFPGGSVIFPVSFVFNGKGYVVGGSAGFTNESTKVYEFDPVTKQWAQKANFAGAPRQAAIGFASATEGFVGGGQTGYTSIYKDMWKYNPINDAWTKVQDIPLQQTAWSTAAVVGNTAYVGTGAEFVSGGLNFTDKFYKYTLPVSVNNTAGNKNILSVYPNPAENTLGINGNVDGKTVATIYSVTGTVVIRTKIQPSKSIDISSLSAGQYIISISSGENISHQRFLKK